MKFFPFKALLLIICLMSLMSLTLQAEDKFPLNIEVNNKKIKTLPAEHNFIGVNLFNDHEFNRHFLKNYSLKVLGETLKSLNIDILRFPGGLNVCSTFWDVPNNETLRALRALPKGEQSFVTLPSKLPEDRFNFFSYMDFLKQNGLKSTVQVNTHTYYDKETRKISLIKNYDRDYAEKRINNTGRVNWELVNKAAKYAAEQVKWVKDNGYKNSVEYWELGNEEYATFQPFNSCYTGNEYAKLASTFIREMKKADPSIKIIVTGFSAPSDYPCCVWGNVDFKPIFNKWFEDVLKNEEFKKQKNNIYAFSIHIYSNSKVEDSDIYAIYKQKILNNIQYLDTNSWINSMKDRLNEYGYSNTHIFMNEFNSNLTLNWYTTLATSKMILSSANNPACQHSDFHQLMDFSKAKTNFGYGLIHYSRYFEQKIFIPYPEAYAVKFLNTYIKGNIIDVNFNHKSKIYVTAVKDGKNVNVIICNMGEDQPLKLKFNSMPNLKYLGNESLGIDIPEDFTVMNYNDNIHNPEEIRIINSLDNAINVYLMRDEYSINLPKYTLSVFKFEERSYASS